ncbi:MAG: efflux RND transporter periplasmic adaptor subunit [Gemmatimonadaceae bacterium]|jgi:multidrug efflux pump subunit AcrA (membrane-fusion protein)|nr:efflux RND transporter periplasmic adaptor subunit [Gemmatimonadaceae bacterium]
MTGQLCRVFGALSVVAVVLTACTSPRAPDAAAADAADAAMPDTALLSAEMVRIGGFTVDSVTLGEWRETRVAPGRLALDPAATQPLGATADGRVSVVDVRVGDRVSAGQVVVRIHSHEVITARAGVATAEASARRAESEARVAESRADRAERLYAAKALSLAELERARADRIHAGTALDAAKAHVIEAHGLYEHLVGDGPLPANHDPHDVLIRTPLSGVVVGREVQPGQVVLPGAPLVTVSRVSALVLDLALAEDALGVVSRGSVVRFTVPSLPGRTFEARVTRVAPVVDSLTRTVAVQAQVANPGDVLRAEQFVQAELTGAAAGNALSVPVDAVQALAGDTVVIVAEQRGEGLHLRAARVRVGRRTGVRAELLEGVPRGTRVIVRGAAVAKAEILKQRNALGVE